MRPRDDTVVKPKVARSVHEGSQRSESRGVTGTTESPGYYLLLEIDERATPVEIKRAYRAAMKRIHPDRARPEERDVAEQHARMLNEAYRVLTDPALRRQYDTEQRSASIQDEIMGRYFGGFGVPGGRNDVYEEIMEAARQENRRQRKRNDRLATTSLLTMFLILLAIGLAALLLWAVIGSIFDGVF